MSNHALLIDLSNEAATKMLQILRHRNHSQTSLREDIAVSSSIEFNSPWEKAIEAKFRLPIEEELISGSLIE